MWSEKHGSEIWPFFGRGIKSPLYKKRSKNETDTSFVDFMECGLCDSLLACAAGWAPRVQETPRRWQG